MLEYRYSLLILSVLVKQADGGEGAAFHSRTGLYLISYYTVPRLPRTLSFHWTDAGIHEEPTNADVC
jgi:hypothetical protein